ncbi:alpha/beta fold hydrolase [Neorhizobium galegae]|nr:alpha/beta fold hydrolase [Neorhizobium galegae]MCQ1849881.1 alpha/beta fold hydrolase [Neorhizobium galegae]
MSDSKLTFLIAHGAWTGGWSWERVLTRLHARGHRAYAPTLTGLCERKHLASPSVNLDTHIDDIVNEAVYKDLTDIVLVGHSYGGIVATGVV